MGPDEARSGGLQHECAASIGKRVRKPQVARRASSGLFAGTPKAAKRLSRIATDGASRTACFAVQVAQGCRTVAPTGPRRRCITGAVGSSRATVCPTKRQILSRYPVVNWLIKPLSMAALGVLFLQRGFASWFDPQSASEYIAGMILLGVAPWTAMVFVWSQWVSGDANNTLVQVSVNDLIMVVTFAPMGAFLRGVTDISVPCRSRSRCLA